MSADPSYEAADLIAQALYSLRHSVTAPASAGHDAFGGHVESLTEAVMGQTAGLHAIAAAIVELAEAVRDCATTQEETR